MVGLKGIEVFVSNQMHLKSKGIYFLVRSISPPEISHYFVNTLCIEKMKTVWCITSWFYNRVAFVLFSLPHFISLFLSSISRPQSPFFTLAQTNNPSFFLSLSISFSHSHSLYNSLSLSFPLYLFLSPIPLSLSLFSSLSIYLSISLFLSLSLYLSIYLSIYLYLEDFLISQKHICMKMPFFCFSSL